MRAGSLRRALLGRPFVPSSDADFAIFAALSPKKESSARSAEHTTVWLTSLPCRRAPGPRVTLSGWEMARASRNPGRASRTMGREALTDYVRSGTRDYADGLDARARVQRSPGTRRAHHVLFICTRPAHGTLRRRRRPSRGSSRDNFTWIGGRGSSRRLIHKTRPWPLALYFCERPMVTV